MSTVDQKNNSEKEQSIQRSIVRYHMCVLKTKYQRRIKVILTSKETVLCGNFCCYVLFFCLSINCLVFIFAYFFCSLEWNKIFIWSIMPADIKFILKCHQEWIILHLCPYWLIPWNLTDVFQKRSSFYGQNYDLTSINSMIFFLNLSNASKGHCESMSFKDKLQDDSLQIQYWCLFKFKGRRNNL